MRAEGLLVTLATMFDECVIRGRRFAPARFCAPLAGFTHSAFRRLLAEFGGCGAVWTEMLAAKRILSESFTTSPWLRRRPADGPLVYQLMVRDGDPLDRILARLAENGVDALDLNLACDALNVRACEAGSALFENLAALRRVLEEARRHWPGLLTAKVRLGSRRPDWQPGFAARLRVLEDTGLDAVVVHPRFFEDKFKRRARHEILPWAASLTRLPLIANGDLGGPEDVATQSPFLQPACGIMIGRMALVRPWLFAAWTRPVAVDHGVIWRKVFDYILEDFAPAIAIRRIKMFARYYAANFVFGHPFYVAISNAESLEIVAQRAEAFFARSPALLPYPTVSGL